MKVICLFICCSFLLSCHPGEEQSNTAVYWSAADYFSKLESGLISDSSHTIKRACLNGSCDTLASHFPKWKAVISPFIDNDINKVAWQGLFQVDTIRTREAYNVVYTREDAKIPIKKISILFTSDGELLEYTSSRNEINPVYSSRQNLHYEAGEMFRIEGFMKVIAVDSTSYDLRYYLQP